MAEPSPGESSNPPERRWQPLSSIDRRVIGVLAEKAKTTPDIYPMSLNAICAGCNQKSNRAPQMQLEPGDVEESLDRLREMGAVGLVEGYGRVQKYRHYLYEWLGVDKVELAVMTELLLRGDQTIGELRGRAARMEPIADLAALRPVLDSLKAKGLLVALLPEGRGQVVTHALYKPRELEAIRAKYQQGFAGETTPSHANEHAAPSPSSCPSIEATNAEAIAQLRADLAELAKQVAELRAQLAELL